MRCLKPVVSCLIGTFVEIYLNLPLSLNQKRQSTMKASFGLITYLSIDNFVIFEYRDYHKTVRWLSCGFEAILEFYFRNENILIF